MKVLHTISTLVLIPAIFSLAACGGSSDSSSVERIKGFANGSEWTCYTDAAYQACSDDKSCSKQTDCKQTKTPKVVPTIVSDNSCQPVNGTALLAEGESCTFSSPSYNGGALQTATCSGGRISAGFLNSKSLTLNDLTIACK